MGTKAAVIGFVGECPRDGAASRVGVRELAERCVGGVLEPVGPVELDSAIWPGEGMVCAGRFPGLDLLACRGFARDRPSEMPGEILDAAAGRRTCVVFMHSVVDWAAFAVWEGGRLVRGVSLAPDSGVLEDLGEPLPFEERYWAGEYALFHAPDYPLPFHPVDFGEEAMRVFFGSVLEEQVDGVGDGCPDPEWITLTGFRAADAVKH